MKTIQGLAWPDKGGDRIDHALMHVGSLEVSLKRCRALARLRTAVQAGWNIGLWPRRLSEVFRRVITFEPDAISRECLVVNVPASVEVRSEALGEVTGLCGLKHKDLGGHKVIDGTTHQMLRLDDIELADLDLLQLDVEGWEGPALRGATATIDRCKPVIHVELRDINTNPGHRTTDVLAWLRSHGYRQVAKAPGSDFIFEAA